MLEVATSEAHRPPPPAARQAREEKMEINVADVAFRIVASFRAHPHISDVLTHVSKANWILVEQTLRVVLDRRTGSRDLSPLARNLVDLMCAERGITGRIMKPYLYGLLTTIVGGAVTAEIFAHISRLYHQTGITVAGQRAG